MKTRAAVLLSVAASFTIAAGLDMTGGWAIERHVSVDFPAGIVWMDNTGTGTAIRAQSDQGTAFEAVGFSSFVGDVDILGSIRIADGSQGEGKVLVSSANGTGRWVDPPSDIENTYAVFVDQKGPNDNGGECSPGIWVTRDLNTATALAGTAISLDASTATMTLDPGTYLFDASAGARDVSSHQIRLRNVTTASTAIVGSTESNDDDTAENTMTRSVLTGYVTVAGPGAESFRIEHRCQNGTTLAFGPATTFDEPNIYTIVHVRKVE